MSNDPVLYVRVERLEAELDNTLENLNTMADILVRMGEKIRELELRISDDDCK